MLLIAVILRRSRRQCPVPSVESGRLSPAGLPSKSRQSVLTSIDAIVDCARYI